uniref:Uncharacterized protein n=1 Tax=Spongospora subterranea TaxID=70186 RepID=A0A0H5QIY1_9EUKA|eukprot:CRZ01607.1 hypothetical protein [Spongospora subterranea]
MIDDSIAHKLLNRSPAFLLRDKIRLFDRFAVSTETVSPALTSRCARDDQLPDNVMFPGWKEVPKPPLPAIPLLAAPLKTDKHFWKPTSRKPVSVDISTSQNINKYHDHAQSSMIVSVPIVADPLWSPRPDLSNSNLEAIEDDLKTIMETAIMANTHVLTSKFQDVLKTQYNQVEHHHRVLADHYKARVTKAMIAKDSIFRKSCL